PGPRAWAGWPGRFRLAGRRSGDSLRVNGVEQPLALREARLGASRHRIQDQVDREEGDELVDRVGEQALLEGRLLDVGSGLAEGRDQEIGPRSRDAAE